MKIFNKRNRNNKAGIRNIELEAWAEMSKKLAEFLSTLEQVDNNIDKIETRLGILVDSKKHEQEVNNMTNSMEAERLAMYLEPHNPGEWELKATLRNHGYSVKDVSDNPDYWYKDIDLIVTNTETGQVSNIEVKWDRKIANTGNLYIEFANPRSKGGKGWFEFCEADLLAYGDAVNKVFYIIKVPALKEFVARNKNALQVAKTWDGSQGYLLPKEYITNLITDTIVAEQPNF